MFSITLGKSHSPYSRLETLCLLPGHLTDFISSSSSLLIPFQPHCSSRWSLNAPTTLLPQSLCTYSSLCLKCPRQGFMLPDTDHSSTLFKSPTLSEAFTKHADDTTLHILPLSIHLMLYILLIYLANISFPTSV